jgi:hypothetical protein
MKITMVRKSKEVAVGPRKLRFTPAKTRPLPDLLTSGGKKKLASVGLFVGEIVCKTRLSLPSSELPNALVFSAAQTLPLPQLSKGVARPKLVSVDLFVGEILVQNALMFMEGSVQQTTGPRVLVFTKAHELPLPVL